MKNKEHLIYYMLANVNLSRQDQSLLTNLLSLSHQGKNITTNQVLLAHKVISKYNKQLTKLGHKLDDLIALEWRAEIIESLPEHTGARVDLIDNEIILKVPFNKKFINHKEKFNKDKTNLPLDLSWDKYTKLYKGKFSLYTLKWLHQVLPDFFSSVNYSPKLYHLIEKFESYKNLIWDPSLVLVNGQYMIAPLTQLLHEKTKHLNLALNPETLFELSKFGIKIEESLVAHDPLLKFSAEKVNKDFKCEYDILTKTIKVLELDRLIEYLSTLKIDQVFIDTASGIASSSLVSSLKETNIEVKTLWTNLPLNGNKVSLSRFKDNSMADRLQYKNSVVISSSLRQIEASEFLLHKIVLIQPCSTY